MMGGAKIRVAKFLRGLRVNLWLIPVLMTAGGFALGVLTLYLDANTPSFPGGSSRWFVPADGESVRAIVSTITGGMLTFVSVVFSVIIVVLTLASSQFGPRLIRNFMADRVVQVGVGTFMAAFACSVAALGRVGSLQATAGPPVFTFAATTLLAFFAVIMFIFLIHHIASSIRAENVIAGVARDMDAAIRALFDGSGSADRDAAVDDSEEPDSTAVPVSAGRDGYVQAVDYESLVAVAKTIGGRIFLQVKPGSFVFSGECIARLYAQDGSGDRDADVARVCVAIVIGSIPTPDQDIEFSVRQLVEIAVRALSPGVNDPFTAVMCVDYLGAALARLAQADAPSRLRRDSTGQVRLVAREIGVGDVIETAFDQVRQHGESSVAVTIRLLETIARLLDVLDSQEAASALAVQARHIAQAVSRLPEGKDREDIERRVATVNALLEEHGSKPANV